MKLSVFYSHITQAAEQQKAAIPDMLKCVRDMGYTMVELDYDHLAAEPQIPAMLQAADLGVSTVYCFFRFEQGPQEERIRSLIDHTRAVGAKQIMPIPGFFPEEAEKHDEALQRMLAGMKALTEAAVCAGLAVTIEDFDSAASPICNSAGMKYFLDRIPELHATLDTGNFRHTGEDVLTAFEVLEERMNHVHLKDRYLDASYGQAVLVAVDGTALYPCPVGRGFIPMKTIIARLRAIGYTGVLAVEHFGDADQLACMRESAAYVLGMLKAAV